MEDLMFKKSTFSRQTVLSLVIISIALINLSFLIIDSSDAFAVIGNDNNKTLNKLERSEGCTPGFWKNHYNELGSSDNQWTSTEFKPTDSFNEIFGLKVFDDDKTLLQALNSSGNGKSNLGRYATAALLNSAHPFVDFDLNKDEVIGIVMDSIKSKNIAMTNDFLETFNDQYCPLPLNQDTPGEAPADSNIDMPIDQFEPAPINNDKMKLEAA